MRINYSVARRRSHKRLFREVKGSYGRRKNLLRLVKETVVRNRVFAYRDRRNRKREFRALWIIRIKAAAEMRGLSYSRFIYGLKLADIKLNRKILSEMAIHSPDVFDEVTQLARKSLIKVSPSFVKDPTKAHQNGFSEKEPGHANSATNHSKNFKNGNVPDSIKQRNSPSYPTIAPSTQFTIAMPVETKLRIEKTQVTDPSTLLFADHTKKFKDPLRQWESEKETQLLISANEKCRDELRRQMSQPKTLQNGTNLLEFRYEFAFNTFLRFLKQYFDHNPGIKTSFPSGFYDDWERNLWKDCCRTESGLLQIDFRPLYAGLALSLRISGNSEDMSRFVASIETNLDPNLSLTLEPCVRGNVLRAASAAEPPNSANTERTDGYGQIRKTYQELLAERQLNFPGGRLVIFDTGLNWKLVKDQFPELGNLANGRKLVEYFTVTSDGATVNLVEIPCESDWRDYSANNHGTRVCVAAVGLKDGVYKGAPLTVLAYDGIKEEDKYATPSANGDEVFVNAVNMLISQVYKPYYLKEESDSIPIPYLVVNCSFTVDWKENPSANSVTANTYFPDSKLITNVMPNLSLNISIYFVAASGNHNSADQIPYPAVHSDVIAVGACDLANPRSKSWGIPGKNQGSNQAPNLNPPKPELWAVGKSPAIHGIQLEGTSFAAPVVAAKMLFILQSKGLQGWTDYFNDLDPMTFPGDTGLNQTKLISICK